jgi:hypothetical protein
MLDPALAQHLVGEIVRRHGHPSHSADAKPLLLAIGTLPGSV